MHLRRSFKGISGVLGGLEIAKIPHVYSMTDSWSIALEKDALSDLYSTVTLKLAANSNLRQSNHEIKISIMILVPAHVLQK